MIYAATDLCVLVIRLARALCGRTHAPRTRFFAAAAGPAAATPTAKQTTHQTQPTCEHRHLSSLDNAEPDHACCVVCG